jgi:hypothetical protein
MSIIQLLAYFFGGSTSTRIRLGQTGGGLLDLSRKEHKQTSRRWHGGATGDAGPDETLTLANRGQLAK